MLSLRSRSVGLLTLTLTLLGVQALPAMAQVDTKIDEQQLTTLYASLQQNPKSSFLQQQIKDQRGRIRGLIDDELNTTINATLSNAQQTPYSQERSVVAMLQAREEETKVDQDLLRGDSVYYGSGSTASGSMTRITASYPEYLAKAAILDEQLASIQFFLTIHTARLNKLSQQQQLDQLSLFITVGKYLLFFLLIVFLERVGRTALFRGIKNRSHRYAAMKIFTAIVYIVIVLWMAIKLSSDYPGIVTSFAIVGAGIAVALQDVLKDVVGWIIIIQRRVFSLGNLVSIGETTGDVIDIGLLRTTLMEVAIWPDNTVHRSGKMLLVPNSRILSESVLNYSATSDFIETQLQFTLMSESNWARASEILEEVLRHETEVFTQKAQRQQAARTQHFFLSHESRSPHVFMEAGERGIVFTLRFLTPIGERKAVSTRIVKAVLERFAAETPRIKLSFNIVRDVPDSAQIPN